MAGRWSTEYKAMMLKLAAVLMLASLYPGLARAEDPSCRNGLFPAENTSFALAKVTGARRTYLRTDIAPCPDDSAAAGAGFTSCRATWC